jgi:hypothetical protein
MFISIFLQDGAVPSAGSGVRPAPPRTSSGGGAGMGRFFQLFSISTCCTYDEITPF